MITTTDAARCSFQKVSNEESEPKVMSAQKAMKTTRHIRLNAITRASCLLNNCREVSVMMSPEMRIFMAPFLPHRTCVNIRTYTELGVARLGVMRNVSAEIAQFPVEK